jgi:hypothetical protein
MAMVSLLCAVYEAMNQRLGSSGVLAGIFIVAALIFNLPLLETFKAFSVEVRLRQSVDQAEEILGQIRKASLVNAKATYMNVAWGGRLGGMPERDKQATLDSMIEQLRAVGIKDEELEDLARP